MSAEPPRDWRGTPIVPGATVVYGAGYGSHSIEMVEATVSSPMLTPTGRVWLDVVRRSAASAWSESRNRVHLGADRLTVVSALPTSSAPTVAELRAEAEARRAAWLAKRGQA